MTDIELMQLCDNLEKRLNEDEYDDIPFDIFRMSKELIKEIRTNVAYSQTHGETADPEMVKHAHVELLYSKYDLTTSYIDGYIQGMKTAAEELVSTMKSIRNSA